MPAVYPFRAVHFAAANSDRLSQLIAPPYDVLDEAAKARLLDRDASNVVEIDLPHLPAKTVGPDETYEQAAADLLKTFFRKRRKAAAAAH